jgi:hypothetical protein
VKICSLYGAGFYYIPGTDTCIKIGGFVRAEINYQAGGSFKPFGFGGTTGYNFDDPGRDRTTDRVRGGISVDTRSQTAYGTLRSYAMIYPTFANDNSTTGGSSYSTVWSPAIFIQFAGFTAGKTASFFDFDLNPYSNMTNLLGSNQGGNGITVFAYTAQFGNGFSASLSLEDENSRRTSISGDTAVTWKYQGRRYPDVVANLRIDQAWGSAQVMGALHDTAAVGTTGATDTSVGWAVGAGLKFNLPMIGQGDYVLAEIAYAKGAMNYVGSQFGAGGFTGALLEEGFPTVTNAAMGVLYDGVVTGGSMDLTKGWSITGGFEHRWNPQWKSSLYGSYGSFSYSDTANATLAAIAGAPAGASADWSLWQIGSRTVWTPVENLDLSVDVLYTDLNKSSFDGSTFGGVTYGGKGFVSAIFRVQRNFWP